MAFGKGSQSSMSRADSNSCGKRKLGAEESFEQLELCESQRMEIDDLRIEVDDLRRQLHEIKSQGLAISQNSTPLQV